MKPDWQTTDGALRLHKGDCREVLKSFPAEMFTACMTDPPYELGFMGRKWDSSGVAFQPATWAAVMRVLKPGAHLLAFGGTRTYHRICCAIEDAGFEIRDCIMWIYGSGFPKSLDVSKAMDKAAGAEREIVGRRTDRAATPKQDIRGGNLMNGVNGGIDCSAITAPATDAAKLWEGYGTALKPAFEPIIVARKPLSGTVAENCQKHGCGALNINGCRVGTEERFNESASSNEIYGQFKGRETEGRTAIGRFPANVIHDGSEEVLAGFPLTGPSSGDIRRNSAKPPSPAKGREYDRESYGHEDNGGSAARFFYCAKASKSDRGEWKEQVPRVRLRADLTPEQVDYVRSELEKAGVPL